jgi:hypothetical protein
MRYLKYRWDEDRADEYAAWGGSWWYFEVGMDGNPVRHVELCDSGVRLRYGPDHTEDEFGGLGHGSVADWDRPADQDMAAQDFGAVCGSGPWYNAADQRDDPGRRP